MNVRSVSRARAGALLVSAVLVATAATPALGGQRAQGDRENRKAERQKRKADRGHARGKGVAGEAVPLVGAGRGKKHAKPVAAKPKAKAGAPKPAAAPATTAAPVAPPVPAVSPPSVTAPASPPVATTTPKPERRARAKRRNRAKPTRGIATGAPRLDPGSPAEGRRDPVQARDLPAKATEHEASESPAAPVTRTVKDLVEVVPEPVKMLLLAMAILSAALGGGYGLTAARARRLSRQRSDLLQEVGLLQTALLPPVPATVGAVRTSVAYRPSDGPGAGGDFYDAMTLSGGRAAFILGDVSGHGRAALARTAFMRYTLRAYLEAGLDPRTTLQVAGRVIDEHLGGDFATVVLAVHDPSSGSLTYACAGHPAPIVVGPGRHEPVLAASSPPIGLDMRTGLRQTTLPLPPGSVVCLYTDGLAEARTERGIIGRPRLGDIVEELGRNATAHGLLDRVAREARLVTDDMATVVLTPTAGVTAGGFRSEQLEVDAADVADGLARQFLAACGVERREQAEALAEATRLADVHGGAVLHVEHGIRGPRTDVLPRNVESLEAASRRVVAAG